MGLPKNYMKTADTIGHALIVPLVVGFISTPLYAFYLTKQGGAAGHAEL